MNNLESCFFNLNKNLESSSELKNAHKRLMTSIQNSIDLTTIEIAQTLHDELQELKNKFPDYHIVLMPALHTQGNDIAPNYGIRVYISWYIFAIKKELEGNRAFSISQLFLIDSKFTLKEYLELTRRIDDKTLIIDVLLHTPSSIHVDVLLNHNLFSNYVI